MGIQWVPLGYGWHCHRRDVSFVIMCMGLVLIHMEGSDAPSGTQGLCVFSMGRK
jgi:hypothetical protein